MNGVTHQIKTTVEWTRRDGESRVVILQRNRWMDDEIRSIPRFQYERYGACHEADVLASVWRNDDGTVGYERYDVTDADDPLDEKDLNRTPEHTLKSVVSPLYVRRDIPAEYREPLSLREIREANDLEPEEDDALAALDVNESVVLGQSSVLQRIL